MSSEIRDKAHGILYFKSRLQGLQEIVAEIRETSHNRSASLATDETDSGGENFKFFSKHAGQNRSPPSDSGPEGFHEKQSTSSYRPSFLRYVPAYVAEEFKDPEFCKNVAGLERMLRVRGRSHSDKSPVDLPGTCLSGGERQGPMIQKMPDPVAGSQERSLARSHDGVSVPDPAEFVFVEHPSAVSVGDSSVKALADQVVESTATGKHDLQDGIVVVRHHPSVESSGGRAHASFPATAGDGNRSRLLEVIESVFPCLVTRFANSPNSSLRVSSHARARVLCFAAAPAFLSDPHSAVHSLPALTDAHADDSLMHGAVNSFVLCRKDPTGRRCTKGGVSGSAEDLRPAVYGGRLQVHFPGGNQAQVPGKGRCGHTFPPPGGSWYPIRVTWIRIGHQAIDGLDEGVWNHTVGNLGAKG